MSTGVTQAPFPMQAEPAAAGPMQVLRNRCALAVVLAAACLVGANAYQHFLENPRSLWHSTLHDRNAHYQLGSSIALALRQGDIVQAVRDVDGSRVWGPLHGVVLGLVQAIGGVDMRLGVLPSLLSWIGSAVLCFLIARRSVLEGGNCAGLLAATLVLVSPAYQAYGVDVMLESMGACLTLSILYAYLLTVQEQRVGGARLLGICLTLLFVQKYNYWVLVVCGLVATEALSRGGSYLAFARAQFQGFDARAWLYGQAVNPFNYLILLSLALTLAVALGSVGEIELAGRSISISSAANLTHLTYLLLLLRMLPWCWRQGRAWLREQVPPLPRQLVYWHVLPVALWFLWPKRLAYFLWYIGPTHGTELERPGFLYNARLYFQWLQEEYHGTQLLAYLILALAAVGILLWRRARPGALLLVCFLAIAAVLTIHHPICKSRCAYSWVPALWLLASIGVVQLVYSPWSERLAALRPALLAALLAVLVLTNAPRALEGGRVSEGGRAPERLSNLMLTEAYLDELRDARQPAIFSNLPFTPLARWTYLYQYHKLRRFESSIKGFSENEQANVVAFQRWLQTTQSDTLLYVLIRPGSCFYEPPVEPKNEQLLEMLKQQTVFQQIRCLELPEYKTTILVWKRNVHAAR